MATAPAPGGPDAAAMMTLSAIAYYDDVSGLLANPNYATKGDWSLVWGPAVSNDYKRLYVVKSQSTGRYAVAIRGSKTGLSWATIYNWAYDLDVFTQTTWPFFNNESAMVSSGAYTQVIHLVTMTWNGTSLAAFLSQIPQGQTLLLTGHSLGAQFGHGPGILGVEQAKTGHRISRIPRRRSIRSPVRRRVTRPSRPRMTRGFPGAWRDGTPIAIDRQSALGLGPGGRLSARLERLPRAARHPSR